VLEDSDSGSNARRLQKRMLKCQANLLLSVRQITQINKRKLTAGVDEEVVINPDPRVKLVNQWQETEAQPTSQVKSKK
jgi:N-terminal domain of reverse transcriptase